MSYELRFTATALEDVLRLARTFPDSQRDQVVEAIQARCRTVASAPPLPSGRWERPSFGVPFTIDGTHYYWAATYRIGEDETTIFVTHVFRVAL